MKTINLSGPQGNALALVAEAEQLCRQLDWRGKFYDIRAEMLRGDYDNVLKTFEKHFGDYAKLEYIPDA